MRRLILALVVVSLLAPAMALAAPAPDKPRAGYFPETGFRVGDPFLSFWETQGGLSTFGYPISRVFYQDGLYRQYFERAIFEDHSDLAGTPYAVMVARLGALAALDKRGEPPFQPVDARSDSACTFFAETSHRLCNGFRAYWQARGGLAAFGYPISEEFVENGVTVQYFERTRFEFHPENPAPYRVLLGRLGAEALAARPVPWEATQPEDPAGGLPAPIGPRPLYDHPVDCGFNVFWWGELDNMPANERYLDRARESGCGWIRMQGQWALLEPEEGHYVFQPLDRVVDAARERGLQVLITINHPAGWAWSTVPGQAADPQKFARLMGTLAAHFRGRVNAWQIWNEPNLAFEAGGLIDPAGYLALLRAAYPAVKASDPDALVVLAGLAPNSLRDRTSAYDDDAYLEWLLALNGGEAAQYFDVAGLHAYAAGNPPDTFWPGNPARTPAWNAAPEFYFRHAEQLHAVLVAAGLGDRPVWITEMGWGTKNDWPAWGFGDWVSEQDQAAYTTRAFEVARTEWPWVQQMFVWNLNYAAIDGAEHPYAAFSALTGDGEPRPVFEAIKALPKPPRPAPAPPAPEDPDAGVCTPGGQGQPAVCEDPAQMGPG